MHNLLPATSNDKSGKLPKKVGFFSLPLIFPWLTLIKIHIFPNTQKKKPHNTQKTHWINVKKQNFNLQSAESADTQLMQM